MVEAPTSAGAGDGDSLLVELRAINEEVEASMQDMEGLVRLAVQPGNAVLSTARLRFSRSLRRHLQHVDGAIMAHLRATDAAGVKPAIDAYRRLLHDYHEAAAHHVARWPSTSVAADWEGYRRSVADMLAKLRKRIMAEQRDILPLLGRARAR